MGIALPQFLLDIDGASGGILLLWIVGVCILLPLVIAVIYLSRSSKYTGNYVMHHTLSNYYRLMKPSLAPRYAVLSEYMSHWFCCCMREEFCLCYWMLVIRKTYHLLLLYTKGRMKLLV